MSDSDSFIDEVNEEVRRDRLFALMRRYGWIAVLLVVLLVGGAAFNAWRDARETARAQAFGDAIFAALQIGDPAKRVAALEDITPPGPGGKAVLGMLTAAGDGSAKDNAAAVDELNAIATDGDVPEIFRRIASYKALVLQQQTTPAAERRIGFEALVQPGDPLRLLAEEQLALIDVEQGKRDEAITRLQRILDDSAVTTGLRRRATQLIVALGGTPDAGGDKRT